MSNRQLEERMEQRQTQLLAEDLGLTVAELDTVGYELEQICSEDGHPYYILVTFLDPSQAAILSKVSGLNGMSVQVGLNVLDDGRRNCDCAGDCEEF